MPFSKFLERFLLFKMIRRFGNWILWHLSFHSMSSNLKSISLSIVRLLHLKNSLSFQDAQKRQKTTKMTNETTSTKWNATKRNEEKKQSTSQNHDRNLNRKIPQKKSISALIYSSECEYVRLEKRPKSCTGMHTIFGLFSHTTDRRTDKVMCLLSC